MFTPNHRKAKMATKAKKRKPNINSEELSLITSFHTNSILCDDLKDIVDFLENRYSGFGVILSKIYTCNGKTGNDFSKAVCETTTLKKLSVNETLGYAISNIFEYGFNVIESYIESPYCIPLREGAVRALIKLLYFFSKDIHVTAKALVGVASDVSDTEWKVVVAHHLLSKLSVSPSYLMDSLHQGRPLDLKCTCGCGEKITGAYGDTSIGVPGGWHGHVDILMDVSIKILTEISKESPESSDAEGEQPSDDIDSSENILDCSREQIRAQAIIFSYLQHKNHPEFKSQLIPTVAISKRKLVVCFYDSVNDMLLETPGLTLLNGKKLYKPTIFLLWLTLNYRYFCSGISSRMKETGYKADFVELIGNKIKQYREDISSPCMYNYPSPDQQYNLLDVDNYREREQEDINHINNDPDVLPYCD